MKLLIFTDLHIDKNADILLIDKNFFKKAFIDYVVELKDTFSVLVITGDISNNMLYSLSFLKDLQNYLPDKIIKYVPGNHDCSSVLTTNPDGLKQIDANSLYDYYLASPFSLKEPLHLTDKLVLIGGLGWYDYSYVDDYLKDVQNKEGFMKEYKLLNWYDGRRIHFRETDKELCKKENNRYRELLEGLKDKEVILANHFIPFQRYVSWKREDNNWNLANAFMGSAELEEIIETSPQVKYVLFGHTHTRYGQQKIGDRTEICSPLGYIGEWKNIVSQNDSLKNMLNSFIKECDLSKQYIEYD